MKDGSPPASVIADLYSGDLVLLYDGRILSEYQDVFARPKCRIPEHKVTAPLHFISTDGFVVRGAHFDQQLLDASDQKFADVAFTGEADLLITGNVKDFPVGDA